MTRPLPIQDGSPAAGGVAEEAHVVEVLVRGAGGDEVVHGRELSAISFQLSAISYELSAVSFQLSAISRQLSAVW